MRVGWRLGSGVAALGATSLAFVLILYGQQTASTAPRHMDPQAQQALERVVQAMGGQPFLQAKSLTARGRIFFFQDGATAGFEPFQSWAVYPDKRRFSYGKTLPVVLINNGSQGWEIDKYGLITQPPEQLRIWALASRFSLENSLRLRIHDPDVLVQYGNVDFIDNVPTQGIDLTMPGGITVRIDLNRQTFLPARISYRIRNVKDQDWDEYSDAYADYKLIDRIQTPMHITRYLNGERIGETFRNFAHYNEEYPSNYFTPQ